MRWIRQALPADRPAIAELYRQCRLGAAWLPVPVARRAAFEADTVGELVLVELESDRAVDPAGAPVRPTGFVSVEPEHAFVHHLYVRQGRRREGVGPRLLAALVGRMALPWQLNCAVANLAARRFYERHGWVQVAATTAAEDSSGEGGHALLELRWPPPAAGAQARSEPPSTLRSLPPAAP